MQEVFEKIFDKLEEIEIHCIEMHDWQGHSAIVDAIESVKQEATEYEECYKDCGECEAYNKAKHHCPKFCKVITEAVKEIEENRNGWIPLSERLPNQDGEFTDVLITCKSMEDGVFVQSAEFYIASDGEPVFDALYHYESVLAWQPLPEPFITI